MHSSSEVLPEKPQMSAPTNGMPKKLKLSSPEGRDSQQGTVSETSPNNQKVLGVLVGALCHPPGIE